MILKCVARCRCSGKVAQEKGDCLYILERNSSSLLHLLRIMCTVRCFHSDVFHVNQNWFIWINFSTSEHQCKVGLNITQI